MKNLTEMSSEKICNFLLNGKKGRAMQVGLDKENMINTSGFVNRTIYEDKNIKIVFAYLVVSEGDIIQQFFLYSKWWGKIKNSFFTLDGFQGKCDEVKCGLIHIEDLKDFYPGSKEVLINNKNQQAVIEITDFASLVLYCQRHFKKSPTYFVSKIIREAPDSWIEIEVTMPDGKIYTHEGFNKKEAAKEFAINYASKLK